MALFNLTELRAGLARDQRLIGLDPGAKTIGVALTDVRLTLASPYASLRRGKLRDNAAELLAIARKEGAGGFVGRHGRPRGAGGARLDAGAVGGNRPAGRAVGRAAVDGGGEPFPDRRGRPEPTQARGGGGPGSGGLDAAIRTGCEPRGVEVVSVNRLRKFTNVSR
jgi:hypothetical protein